MWRFYGASISSHSFPSSLPNHHRFVCVCVESVRIRLKSLVYQFSRCLFVGLLPFWLLVCAIMIVCWLLPLVSIFNVFSFGFGFRIFLKFCVLKHVFRVGFSVVPAPYMSIKLLSKDQTKRRSQINPTKETTALIVRLLVWRLLLLS